MYDWCERLFALPRGDHRQNYINSFPQCEPYEPYVNLRKGII